ncbi:hypothetical protein BS47DRAFT_1484816 [Hydnum rufescens UP504]|uniref:Uncharacterized protein n=1 Tax=Hydnum rufescens UP504 TaxID=1448309 RepID=A0A9P6B1V6_9AGAM|nr:hypothetical protein BS47DRAFT_1484816 [Hydnum rufescens UP504]
MWSKCSMWYSIFGTMQMPTAQSFTSIIRVPLSGYSFTSLSYFFVFDSFGTMSALLVSAPTPPEEALESLPPRQAISVTCWELPNLHMPSALKGLSDWRSDLSATAALHYKIIRSLAFINKLTVHIEQQGWKGPVKYARSLGHRKLLPLWVWTAGEDGTILCEQNN